MAAINTTCNPFIYAVFMPVYRKAVISTFCKCFKRGNSGLESSTHNTTVSTVM